MARLPGHIVALIHQTELHESGWWNEAIDRLLLASLWLAEGPLGADAIERAIRNDAGVDLGRPTVEEAIHRLVQREQITARGDQYSLTLAARMRIETEVAEADALAGSAAQQFTDLLAKHCPELQDVVEWEDFNERFLLGLVSELGASVYRILVNDAHSPDFHTAVDAYIQGYPAEHRERLRAAAIAFLDPTNTTVRDYVLQQLAASFVAIAAGLDEPTLKALADASRSRPVFTLFLDTNFVFSLLGLHENPANEAAQAVKALADAIADM